jgi:hypothetical protein
MSEQHASDGLRLCRRLTSAAFDKARANTLPDLQQHERVQEP